MHLLSVVTGARPFKWIGLVPTLTGSDYAEPQAETTVLRDSIGTAAIPT
jgi:hypothetical protein